VVSSLQQPSAGPGVVGRRSMSDLCFWTIMVVYKIFPMLTKLCFVTWSWLCSLRHGYALVARNVIHNNKDLQCSPWFFSCRQIRWLWQSQEQQGLLAWGWSKDLMQVMLQSELVFLNLFSFWAANITLWCNFWCYPSQLLHLTPEVNSFCWQFLETTSVFRRVNWGKGRGPCI